MSVVELLVVMTLLASGMAAVAAGGLLTGGALCVMAALWGRSLYRRL